MTALWPLLFLLMSCSNDVEEIPLQEELSPVSVGQVTVIGNAVSTALEPEHWVEFKNHAKVDLKICLKDRASNIDFVEEPFDVLNSKGQIVNKYRKTDHNGCLYWTIDQSFEYLEQERFFKQDFLIRSMGSFQFRKTVPVAYNPWSGEVLDLTRQSYENYRTDALALLRPFNNFDVRSFEFNRVNDFSPVSNVNGTISYQYRGSFRPFYQRRGLNGDVLDFPITKGLFNLDIKIIEYDIAKEAYTEVGQKSLLSITADNGLLEFQAEVTLHPETRSNQDNHIYIWAKIIPQGPLEQYSGVQIMQGLQSLQNNQLLDVKSLENDHIFGFIRNPILVPTLDAPEQPLESIPRENQPIVTQSSRLKLQQVEFTDQGNVNRFDSTENDNRVRRIDIKGAVFDELAGNRGEYIQNGEFKVEVELTSAQTNDRYSSDRFAPVLVNGEIETFVYLPYQLYGKERNIYFDLILTGLSGRYKDLVLRKRLAYNPWSKKGFDTDRLPAEEIVGAQNPQIKLSQIELQWPQIDFQDSLLVDRHLNLGFNLDFHTTLELFYDREKHIGEDENDKPIEFGNYEVEAFLFTPNKDNVSYYQSPNYQMKIEDFTLVTASKSQGSVVKGVDKGFLEVKLSFPFTIAEMPLQHLKNLLVLHIRPLDGYNKLRPLTIATPFSARSKNQSETHLGHQANLYEGIRSTLPFYEKYIEDGLHYKMKQIVDIYKDVDSLETYRAKLATDYAAKYLPLKWKEFHDEVTKTTSELRSGQFRNLHKGRDSRHILAKSACRYHFLKTLKLNTPEIQNDLVEAKKLNDVFQACLSNPLQFFNVVPTAHIVTVLDDESFTYKKDALTKANFINQLPYQEIQKGRTFFAGTGERLASGTGTRESDQLMLSYKASAETPAPFYLNVSVTKNKIYEAYQFQTKHNYLFDANRHYQTIINNAEYEMLEVSFNVEVQRCVKIFNNDYAYHICYEGSHRQELSEKWFQISTEYHQGERGIITDGEIHQGQSSGYQLIRGSFNFASQWNTYMQENRLLVEDITEKIEIPRSYDGNTEFEGQDIPYESLIQNAFPGTYIQPTQSSDGQ